MRGTDELDTILSGDSSYLRELHMLDHFGQSMER